jgi:hypothetical protein
MTRLLVATWSSWLITSDAVADLGQLGGVASTKAKKLVPKRDSLLKIGLARISASKTC